MSRKRRPLSALIPVVMVAVICGCGSSAPAQTGTGGDSNTANAQKADAAPAKAEGAPSPAEAAAKACTTCESAVATKNATPLAAATWPAPLAPPTLQSCVGGAGPSGGGASEHDADARHAAATRPMPFESLQDGWANLNVSRENRGD